MIDFDANYFIPKEFDQEDFINNKFLARDTKGFREYVKNLQPDIKMEFDYENPETGETEVRPITMGVSFFWPTE